MDETVGLRGGEEVLLLCVWKFSHELRAKDDTSSHASLRNNMAWDILPPGVGINDGMRTKNLLVAFEQATAVAPCNFVQNMKVKEGEEWPSHLKMYCLGYFLCQVSIGSINHINCHYVGLKDR